jgi:DNA-directed RNA polymerase subunit F
VELVDKLLATQEQNSELAQRLSQAREHLDNFSFGDAEPLLSGISEELQAGS